MNYTILDDMETGLFDKLFRVNLYQYRPAFLLFDRHITNIIIFHILSKVQMHIMDCAYE